MLARSLLLVLLVPYGLWLVAAYDYHFLDGVNLLFHEAGHVFFGLLGETLGMLGGTLGQLVFPIAGAVHFATSGRSFDACVCGVWLGESVLNVGRYLGDAQAMALPLVGGEIHDWNWLLSKAGLLSSCETLARLVHVLGSAIVLGSLGLAYAALASERARVRAAGETGLIA